MTYGIRLRKKTIKNIPFLKKQMWMLMHADINMDTHEAEEERLHKKRKHSNGDPLCRPRLYGWYTIETLTELLGPHNAKNEASTAPSRFTGQGYDKPCKQFFLITDGEDALKVYIEQFYVPPPKGYPGR